MQAETSRRRKHQTSEESYAGPARPHLPTPPETPSRSPSLSPNPQWKRARRTKGSSEDSIPGIRIGEFRVGGPILCDLPVYTGNLPPNSRLSTAWNAWLEKEIVITLQKCNLDWQAAEAVARYTAATHETPVETVVISATKHNDSDNWLKACQTILHLYTSSGLKDINIEIADGRAFLPVNSFAVERTMAISTVWSSLETRIITILKGRDWLALELLRRGINQKAQDNPATVVITIYEASEMDWTEVRENIVTLLERNRFNEVAVEIIRGKVSYAEDPFRQPLGMNAYETNAEMGRSIGPGNLDDASGTFCGYIRLRSPDGGHWRIFGMTCHHVALPNALSHPSMLKWTQHGMAPGDGQATKLPITMPSRSDHIFTINLLRTEIAELQTPEHESIREMLDTNQEVRSEQRGKFRRDERVLATYRSNLAQAEAFFAEGKEHLGTVFAASGLRQTLGAQDETMCLDWALIEVSSTRSFFNFYPEMESFSNTKSAVGDFVPMYKSMVTTALPEIDQKVLIYGRISGWTVGIYNGIHHTLLNFRRRDERGVMVETTSRAHAVGRMPGFKGSLTGTLGQAGDSGSAVLDRYGSFLGLYFGANTGTGTGLFILWQDLFADIQNITGASAVELLPGPR